MVLTRRIGREQFTREETINMSLKKLGSGQLVALALGAVVTNSALAAEGLAVTEGSAWYNRATKLAKGSTSTLTCKLDPETKVTIATTFGTNNIPLILQATGAECIGAKAESDGTNALASGKIKFTGVSVVEPAGCTIAATIETFNLIAEVEMKKGTEFDTVKIEPVFEPAGMLEFEIAGCAAAGPYVARGKLYAEPVNKTGVQAKIQTIKFSQAIQESAVGTTLTGLTFGTHAAFLNATICLETEGHEFGWKKA
jgi:hypothetical protein